MKKSSNEKAALNIEEVAELYKGYANKAKEIAKFAEPYKEELLEYAKANPAKFDGNTLLFLNGVRIELRESDKPRWDADAVDYEWVGDAIDAGLGEAVAMTINAKGLPAKPGKEQKELLKAIGYKVEKAQTYAVYADSKK